MSLFEKIDLKKVPKHVAIIMDGNGRWAKKRNKPRIVGHNEGTKSVKAVINAAIKLNIKYLTLYAFSKENWQRPKDEVEGLMQLLKQGVVDELDTMMKENIKLLVIGSDDELKPDIKEAINLALEKTKNNTGLNLIIALNYSARWEIVNAAKKIASDVLKNKISIDQIDENLFSDYLSTQKIPDPDLLIRTSGEIRISNFLLWQLAYTELYFTEILWPDFREEEFYSAIINYQNRERRFGKISEQIKNNTL